MEFLSPPLSARKTGLLQSAPPKFGTRTGVAGIHRRANGRRPGPVRHTLDGRASRHYLSLLLFFGADAAQAAVGSCPLHSVLAGDMDLCGYWSCRLLQFVLRSEEHTSELQSLR